MADLAVQERSTMGKLVRDRIPEIIVAAGGTPRVRELDDEEYDAALLDKLREEVDELRAAPAEHRLEEAADVYEVLLALLARQSLGAEALAAAAHSKRRDRGGFEKRLWWDA
jgi:predicted house-cleaning noncanonical NTP pyrophosphatase (MazG superfamily)